MNAKNDFLTLRRVRCEFFLCFCVVAVFKTRRLPQAKYCGVVETILNAITLLFIMLLDWR